MIYQTLCAAVAALLISPAASATPVTVQSVLFDRDNDVLTAGAPTIDPSGNPVGNGAFTILRPEGAFDVPVGNGIDEWTRGLFDLTGAANYAAFRSVFGAQPWQDHRRHAAVDTDADELLI